MHQKWTIAACCFALALLAFVASFILGGKIGGLIALAVLLIMMGISVWYIAHLKPKELWHRAIDIFRKEAKNNQHPLASFSLEEFWNRAQTCRPDAINTFFDTALRVLYNQENHETQTLWIMFLDHIHIQKLLYAALQQLKRS